MIFIWLITLNESRRIKFLDRYLISVEYVNCLPVSLKQHGWQHFHSSLHLCILYLHPTGKWNAHRKLIVSYPNVMLYFVIKLIGLTGQ